MDLAGKDFRTVISSISIRKDFTKTISILRREMEGVKPSGISRNESKLSEIKFSLNGINNGLGTTEEMIGNLDVRDAEIIQNYHKGKRQKT